MDDPQPSHEIQILTQTLAGIDERYERHQNWCSTCKKQRKSGCHIERQITGQRTIVTRRLDILRGSCDSPPVAADGGSSEQSEAAV